MSLLLIRWISNLKAVCRENKNFFVIQNKQRGHQKYFSDKNIRQDRL